MTDNYQHDAIEAAEAEPNAALASIVELTAENERLRGEIEDWKVSDELANNAEWRAQMNETQQRENVELTAERDALMKAIDNIWLSYGATPVAALKKAIVLVQDIRAVLASTKEKGTDGE